MKNKGVLVAEAKKPVDRKLLILIGLVLLTAFVIFYQATSGPAVRLNVAPSQPQPQVQQSRVTRKLPAKSSHGKVQNPLYTEDPDLLPQLQKEARTFENEKRNLFAFFVPPPPPPPPPPKPVCGDGKCNGTENNETCESDCPPPPPPPVCGDSKCEGTENFQSCPSDCDPPPPPEITLKYIGYLKDHIGDIAFFTDGKEVYMGRVGDIIANRYRIVNITEEGVELGYVNLKTGQSKTIPFSGNKS
jgi:hypothetical protein